MDLVERLRNFEGSDALGNGDFSLMHEAAAALEAARMEVERLNRILGRIVEGDGDSTVGIRWGADAFAAAMEYLRNTKPE